MANSQISPYFVGIDVGTSGVRCVVGSIDEQGAPEIIGHASAPVSGMRRGVVAHVEEVADAIVQVVNDAERLSGRSIKSATVNINGSHVEGLNSHGVVAISAANREISEEDRLRVEEAASVMKMPANRDIIQVFPKAYKLDGQGSIKDPVGMQGVRLEVDTHIVTASVPNLRNLEQALERASIFAKHRTVSSLASAEAVLTRQQREAGTAVVDIGAGTTNVIIVEDGEVQHIAVIPVGGIHITNDLAIGLKTDLDVAEAIKLEHASLERTSLSTVSVKVNKEQHTFDVEEVTMIMEARVEELLELIDKELKKINRSKKLPGGIVFTGGSSKIKGIGAFAKEQLELPAKQATILPVSGLSDIADDVAYATPIGLMLLDMLLDGQSGENSNRNTVYNSALNSVSRFVSRFKSK
jgi:cell division protein FtsA